MIETGLIRYDAMCSAIAECHSVDEVKELRNKARALEVYAQQAKNLEAEDKAVKIRLRAERRSGELLREMKESGSRHSGRGDQKTGSRLSTPKLSDLGISKTQSSQWQALAEIPEAEFEERLQSSIRPSTEGILNIANGIDNPKVSSDCVRTWGIFKDLERYGLIELSLADLVSGMTEGMVEDMERLIPLVSEWIKES